MFGGLIGIAWVIVLVLKIAGLAFVATSWWLIILWPLVPIAILFVLGMLGLGIGALIFVGTSNKYRR